MTARTEVTTKVIGVYESRDNAKWVAEREYRRVVVRWVNEDGEEYGETHDRSFISGGGAPIYIHITEYTVGEQSYLAGEKVIGGKDGS